MARRRSKNSKSLSKAGEIPPISNRRLPRLDITRYSDSLASDPPEKFEWFRNNPFIRLIDSLESDSRPVLDRGGKFFNLSHRLFFKVPKRVKFCVDRSVRRQVLFAKKRAGFSGSARKRKWNRSQTSYYRC